MKSKTAVGFLAGGALGLVLGGICAYYTGSWLSGLVSLAATFGGGLVGCIYDRLKNEK